MVEEFKSASDKNVGSAKIADNTPEQRENPADLVRRAREDLQKQNDLLEQELVRKEELRGKIMMGGKTEAGIPPPAPVKLTPQEYAKKVMRGEANPLKDD